MATPPSSVWDLSVLAETLNFFYDDESVLLRIHNKRFKVSRSRLCNASPVFKSMFALPQSSNKPEPVVLHNDPDDFAQFLWFLHVSPIQFQAYERTCPALQKFTTALGIALVAHMYESTEILNWATGEVFGALERHSREFVVRPDLMCKVHQLAVRHPHKPVPQGVSVVPAPGSAASPSILTRTRDVWADLLYESTDPVEWLEAARSSSVQDTILQALAYFHIQKHGPRPSHATDNRLTGLDRRRLLIGAYNFRMKSSATIIVTAKAGSSSVFNFGSPWRPRYDPGVQEHLLELWQMFTRDPWSFAGDSTDSVG